MRTLQVLLLAIAAVTATAGCVDVNDALGAAETDITSPLAPRLDLFTVDMGFSPVIPPADAVRTGGFFDAWADGRNYPTWRSEPLAVDTVVSDIVVTLHLRSTGPVAESGRFPDMMVYGGSGDSWIGFASTKFSSVMVPGTVYSIQLDLAVPEGGLVIPAGETFGLKVVPVMFQNERTDIEILVGGDAGVASSVVWTPTPTRLSTGAWTRDGYAGETAGSAYAGDAAPESTSHRAVVPTDVPPSAFLVWMNTTEATGIPDVDLFIVAPDGTELTASGTPTPREFVRLMGPNLALAGEYTIAVTSYGAARASFTVEWAWAS